MNKKLLVIGCALGLIFGTAANAKDGPHHHKMPFPERPSFEQMDEQIAKRLELTKEQQAQVKKVNEAGRAQMDELMAQMKTLREKMDEVRGKNMQDFEAVLTPVQKIRWEDWKAERRFEHFNKKDFKKFDGNKKSGCGCERCPMMKGKMMPPPAPQMPAPAPDAEK